MLAVIKMKRRNFLIQFLGALGAKDIKWFEENANYISGRVIYDHNDPEKIQDFCWHLSENDAPESSVLELARLINEKNLVRIDQITVNRDRLHQMYNESRSQKFSNEEFIHILEELKRIKIPMVDEGVEGDFYFFHE